MLAEPQLVEFLRGPAGVSDKILEATVRKLAAFARLQERPHARAAAPPPPV